MGLRSLLISMQVVWVYLDRHARSTVQEDVLRLSRLSEQP